MNVCRPRADPLVLPGVAQVPFDPTQKPVPKYKPAAWHEVLLEFFTQD
jgi:hypothetical protein